MTPRWSRRSSASPIARFGLLHSSSAHAPNASNACPDGSLTPRSCATPFVRSRLAEYPDPEKAYREMASTQLNGRMAQPDEIAAAALYLAADVSAMVTGSNLLIDGGWSAGK